MIRSFVYIIAGAILLAGCIVVHETQCVSDDKPASARVLRQSKKPPQLLRHVVLFKFKNGTTTEQIRKIENGCCALPSKISYIYDFEWGKDISVDDRNQGFTHCFIVTFRSEQDRDKYLPHPAHQELVEFLRPHIDQMLVIDYWMK
jgi:hypothetical protein